MAQAPDVAFAKAMKKSIERVNAGEAKEDDESMRRVMNASDELSRALPALDVDKSDPVYSNILRTVSTWATFARDDDFWNLTYEARVVLLTITANADESGRLTATEDEIELMTIEMRALLDVMFNMMSSFSL